ncbi:MAG: hypothetical protein ACD_75C01523G0004 [uncultured bacterium]|nr:MAG: hypothetical protein ACD_75C01523G0004 [uncultured bacterium]
MAERWQEIVADIEEHLRVNLPGNPELRPLLTSLLNFNNKYCRGGSPADLSKDMRCSAPTVKLSKVLTCFNQAGLVLLEKKSHDRLVDTIERQAEEIDALDKRVKRLLER